MTPTKRLDQVLLKKIAKKKDKSLKYIRERVSKRARRMSVTSEEALLLWAKELGIGTSHAFRQLEPHMQEQVRALTSPPSEVSKDTVQPAVGPSEIFRSSDPMMSAVDLLVEDSELLSRCKDLLRRGRHLDRVVREATTVLEDRIRNLSGITDPLRPVELVNRALNSDRNRAILLFGSTPNEQQGFHSICRGVVLAFRHKAHHRLSEDVNKEDAVKFLAFIDMLLGLLATTQKRS